VLHRNDPLSSRTGWLKPFLLYLAITLRLLFFHLPISLITKPIHLIWNYTGVKAASLIPDKLKIPAGAMVVIGVMLIGAFANPESQDNNRANRAVSLLGLAVFLFVLWVTSKHRSMVKWHTVIVGMLVQFIIALFVLRSKVGCERRRSKM
jgi:concentrative nucleoside transporter, CNT family